MEPNDIFCDWQPQYMTDFDVGTNINKWWRFTSIFTGVKTPIFYRTSIEMDKPRNWSDFTWTWPE